MGRRSDVTTTETASASIGPRGRALIVTSVSMGLFAAALDTTVNVALPAMSQSLGASLPALQWIIIAFVATNTALSVVAGSAADRFGAERFFLGGLLLYALAMLLIAFAPNLQVLVALRVLQGVAAAAVMTVGPVLVAAAFPVASRGRVLGATASAQATGMVASGFAGGLLVLVGLFTRPAAFVLAGEMAAAYWLFHAPKSFYPLLNGGDSAVLFCFVFLYLVVAGAGAWSLDAARETPDR